MQATEIKKELSELTYEDIKDTAVGLPPDSQRDWYAYKVLFDGNEEKEREIDCQIKDAGYDINILHESTDFMSNTLFGLMISENDTLNTKFQAASYYYWLQQHNEYLMDEWKFCKVGIANDLLKMGIKHSDEYSKRMGWPKRRHSLSYEYDYIKSIVRTADNVVCKRCNTTYPPILTKSPQCDKSEAANYVSDGMLFSGYGRSQIIELMFKDSTETMKYQEYDTICDKCTKELFDNGIIYNRNYPDFDMHVPGFNEWYAWRKAQKALKDKSTDKAVLRE